jgi:hypothetical protein
VPGGEPAQAFVLCEFHEPDFIQEGCDLVPWGLVKKKVVALGDDQACFRRNATYPAPSKVSGAPLRCSSPRDSSRDCVR